MENTMEQRVAKTVEAIKQNPVHMEKHVERRRRNRGCSIKNQTEKPRRMTEEDIFDDNEDITVYVDFCGGIFPHNEPLSERREAAFNHMHRHDFFEMMFVYSGVCYCYLNRQEYLLNKGAVWIFNAQCAHSVVVPNDGSTLINILLRKSTFTNTILDMIQDNDLFLDFFLNSIHNANNLPHHIQYAVEPGSMIETYLFKIILEYASENNYRQKIMKLMLCALLTELARDYQLREANKQRDEKDTSDILQVISFISDHYTEISLKSLAEQFHYSPDYLSKRIEKYTGHSFSDYIRQYKFNRAAYLVAHTEQPFEQISSLIGYSLRSSFDREFKRYFGLTPRQYRQQNRESAQ